MTVPGMTVPSCANSWVIPTFLPMIPLTISRSSQRPFANGPYLFVFFPERLDLHVHAGRKIQLHQRVDGLRRRLEDVDQSFVRAQLELLARFLVDVRRT